MAKVQKELPGVEAPSIPEIEDAAEGLRTIREKRMKLTTQEVVAAENLRQVMHDHKTEIYRYDDYIVELKAGKEKVKVRLDRDGEEDEDEE
jgi:hypothetical protein